MATDDVGGSFSELARTSRRPVRNMTRWGRAMLPSQRSLGAGLQLLNTLGGPGEDQENSL